MTAFTESVVEQAALGWLETSGWQIAHGPNLAPDISGAERRDYGEVILEQRLREAVARLNPTLPAEAREDAFRKLTRLPLAVLELKNAADEDANLPRLRVQFIPGQPLLERFETMVKLLAEKTHHLEQQFRTLVAPRDALLPGLISGELRIRDAERFMEGVGA